MGPLSPSTYHVCHKRRTLLVLTIIARMLCTLDPAAVIEKG